MYIYLNLWTWLGHYHLWTSIMGMHVIYHTNGICGHVRAHRIISNADIYRCTDIAEKEGLLVWL